MRRSLMVVVLFGVSVTAWGQKAVFKWSDEMCEYAGTYDSRKYTKKQLENCYQLSCQNPYLLSHTPAVFKPSDIGKLSLHELDLEYKQKRKEIGSLDLPNTRYWMELRLSVLTELDQFYKVSRIAYLGYVDPNKLKGWFYQDTCLRHHVDALVAGGDSLLNHWHDFTAQLVTKNCCPDRVWSEYFDERNSECPTSYAQVCITTFGWWNSAIRHIDTSEKKFDFNRKLTEFRRLFLKTRTISCDEP
jgi:hypothetical protein